MERRAGHPVMLTIAPRFGNGCESQKVSLIMVLVKDGSELARG